MSHADFIFRLCIAVGCGLAIGFERQFRQRRAGLRTNALVGAGACLFAVIGGFMGDVSVQGRIAAQIVTGIGFLGGGVILREGLNVRGLNTAATLWCTAAVGTLAGCGYVVESMVGSVIVVASNVLLRPLADRINRAPAEDTEIEMQYSVRASCRRRNEGPLRLALVQALAKEPLVLQSMGHVDLGESVSGKADRVELRAVALSVGAAQAALERVVNHLSVSGLAIAVSWELVKADGEQIIAPASAPLLAPEPPPAHA